VHHHVTGRETGRFSHAPHERRVAERELSPPSIAKIQRAAPARRPSARPSTPHSRRLVATEMRHHRHHEDAENRTRAMGTRYGSLVPVRDPDSCSKIRARNVSGHEASLLAERKPFRARLRRSRGRKWRPALGTMQSTCQSEIARAGSLRTPRRRDGSACGRAEGSARMPQSKNQRYPRRPPPPPCGRPALHIFLNNFRLEWGLAPGR